MANDPNANLMELLHDGRWLRRMAHRLANSSDEGDDLAQSACLKALQAPPSDGESLRGWFAQVLRNLRWERHRSDSRRSEREQRLPRAAAQESASELVERASVQRAVLDAVLNLHEPYRATVLLRFFEELPPREIATRMKVPVATIHTRLQRAFRQLRERLDGQFGDRSAWAAVLLSLPGWPAKTTPLWIFFMQAKAFASLAVVSIGAFLLWMVMTQEPPAPTGPPSSGLLATVASSAKPNRSLEPVATERSQLATKDPQAVAVPPVTDMSRLLRGRVVDSDGEVVGSLALQFAPEAGSTAGAVELTSEPDGSFQFVLDPSVGGTVRARHEGWRTVCSATVGGGVPSPMYLVVVERSVALAGQVFGDDGRALPTATVRVVWPKDLRARMNDISDRAETEQVIRRCDDRGQFELLSAHVRGEQLLTTAPGHLPDRRPLPQLADRALAITLRAPSQHDGVLRGGGRRRARSAGRARDGDAWQERDLHG